jgi:hypothetical protein
MHHFGANNTPQINGKLKQFYKARWTGKREFPHVSNFKPI